MMSCRAVFLRQCRREWGLCKKQPRLNLHAFLFFVMMLVFFPLTLPPSSTLLREVGPGLLWVAALFAVLLSSEGLFQRAYEEGLLEQAWVSGESMVMMVLATLLTQLVMMMFPMLLFFPIMGILYQFNVMELLCLLMGFLIGVPSLFFMAALAAALNVGRVQKTTLMALLVLPLVIPVMIFGSGVVRLQMMHGQISGIIALLSAFFLLCLGSIPFAIVVVLRLRFED
ncbi:MAG: heme exporter protein CcmB [Gammaproteobacteria bacterium]|nr:heme exporter protein CcmB [Gammaproteobacteria bacterium]